MLFTKSNRDHDLRLVISGSFTIFQAADYKTQLLDVLEKAPHVLEVDLSGVEEIDTAGLQLLLLLQRETEAQGKQVLFSGLSGAVEYVVDMLQLRDRFHFAAAASESDESRGW